MIILKEVKTKKEQKEFLNFPLKLYKNNPYFVPPLYMDEKKIFDKNYMYLDQAEAIYYNAYIDNKMVGRISGIIQKAANNKYNEKRVRFTRFDSIDNQEVADLLFKKVEEWAKDRGMDTIVGPLGFSDLEREGLLIEGFSELSTFEEQYNFDYYQRLIENYGFKKEIDWLERKVYAPEALDERLERISSMMLKRYNLKFAKFKNTKEIIKRYGVKLFKVIDETYKNIYGSVPFTDGMRDMLINNFKLIVKPENVSIIVDGNDDVVCFGICFPSIAKSLQKSSGHLTIPAIFRVLKAIKKPEVIDLALIGVLPEYEGRGVSSAILVHVYNLLKKYNAIYAETNLNLETNTHIHNQWKSFKTICHKRRRSFVKKID